MGGTPRTHERKTNEQNLQAQTRTTSRHGRHNATHIPMGGLHAVLAGSALLLYVASPGLVLYGDAAQFERCNEEGGCENLGTGDIGPGT